MILPFKLGNEFEQIVGSLRGIGGLGKGQLIKEVEGLDILAEERRFTKATSEFK